MDQLCVTIYERDESVKKTLHDVLVTYAVQQNVEVVIHWLKEPLQEDAVKDACLCAQLALVSAADAEKARLIGGLVYQANPACDLVYYGGAIAQSLDETVRYFEAFFPSRPIRYLYRPSRQDFSDTLLQLSAQAAAQKHFLWESKGMKYRVPYSSIRYFRSDRNYEASDLISRSKKVRDMIK